MLHLGKVIETRYATGVVPSDVEITIVRWLSGKAQPFKLEYIGSIPVLTTNTFIKIKTFNMTTLTTFILGTLSGLFTMGIVYTFIGVLTMRKEIKKLKDDYRFLRDQMNLMDNEITQRINRREDLLNQRIDEVISNTANDVDETHKYIDKRIDKTIDILQGNINLVYKETEKLNS